MGKLWINGKWEKVPRAPHHKSYYYRCHQYFNQKWSIITMDNCLPIRQAITGIIKKTRVPLDILIDPTNSCNLKCKGCWASEYDQTDNLSYEELDDILQQCEELKIRDILMTGGEPLVRRDDILKLAKKYSKHMTFGIFTNAQFIDEKLADKIAAIPNLTVFISIEGTEEETDFRRGDGVYKNCINAMGLLKERGVAFAISVCYHSLNYKYVSSKEFLDDMQDKGAWMAWYFNYFPVGKNADTNLVCSPEQREYVAKKLKDYYKEKKFVIIDFWNYGHMTEGCVAAGTGFVHINAKGDIEPCAFCHYSDSNIHDVKLKDALMSPFFSKFRSMQPFNKNPLMSCPMVDNPEKIVEIVNATKAKSTHIVNPETAEELAEKMKPIAKAWEDKAMSIDLDLKEYRFFEKMMRAKTKGFNRR
jgi:MoaA/NifB/PqqE/SkfB family radical SAM enzyme